MDNINKGSKARNVEIDIEDIKDELVQRIMNEYGVEWDEVTYVGNIKKLIFELPALDENLCNEVNPSTEEGGCGSTGGGCMCGEDKGHKGLHECKRCGEEW
jgi:hypothetical protein